MSFFVFMIRVVIERSREGWVCFFDFLCCDMYRAYLYETLYIRILHSFKNDKDIFKNLHRLSIDAKTLVLDRTTQSQRKHSNHMKL